jgi:hypothetical protein
MIPFALSLSVKCFALGCLALYRKDQEPAGLAFFLGTVMAVTALAVRWM